jgi:hypothetical protein
MSTGTGEDPWQLTTAPAPARRTRRSPPLLEALGLAELAHQPRGNRVRAST